jgi:hypothetical protein
VERPAGLEPLFEIVRQRCEALPEVTVRWDRTTYAFEVRRRIVLYLSRIEDPSGATVDLLVVNADPDERAALLATGHPFFAPGSGRNRLGVVVDESSDWDELGELITESYRLVAPKKLVTLLDG